MTTQVPGGRLNEGAFIEVLRKLCADRATGALHLTRSDQQMRLRLVSGQIVGGSPGMPDRLGEVLVRCGLLGSSDLERALGKARGEGRRLGPVLREMDLVSQDRIEDALRLQVRDVLFTAIFWRDGRWKLAPDDAPTPILEEVTLRLSTEQLLLEAVHRIEDPALVRRALGDLDLPLRRVDEPALRLEGRTLGPADGFVLSRVDGIMTAGQILAISPLPADDVARSLMALLAAGVIERGPGPRPAAQAAVPAIVAPGIEEAFLEVQGKDHFQALGLDRVASPDQVKTAFLSRARRFHPDALGSSLPADMQEKARVVFTAVTEAYRVLNDPESRTRYEERFGRPWRPAVAPSSGAAPDFGAPSPRGAGSAAGAPTPAPLTPVEHVMLEAEEHFGAGRFWEASVSLEEVLARASGRLRQRAYLLLARTLAKSPSGSKRAVVELRALLEEDPGCVEAYLTLGQLYRDKGLAERAAAMFRQVLVLDPRHARAVQELRTLPAGEAAAGGVFGRLLSRTP